MDIAARKVLNSQKIYLTSNLILENHILDLLLQDETLTEEMVQRIQVQETNSDKIDKLLYILQKRGPTAFSAFIDSLRMNHKFVANQLMEVYQHELALTTDRHTGSDKSSESFSKKSSTSSIESMSTSPESDNSPVQKSPDNVAEPHQPTTLLCRRCSEPAVTMPTKPTDGNNNSPQVSGNQFKQTYEYSSHLKHHGIQEWLDGLYTKLKAHQTRFNMREITCQSLRSPVPVTFDMLDDLVDAQLKTEAKCYRELNDRDRRSDIFTHILKLKKDRKDLRTQLDAEVEKRNKSSDYAIKQEQKVRSNKYETDRLKTENQKLTCEMLRIKEINEAAEKELEDLKVDSDRKEKELEDAKSELKEAKSDIEYLTQEKLNNESEIEQLKGNLERLERNNTHQRHGRDSRRLVSKQAGTDRASTLLGNLTVTSTKITGMESPARNMESPTRNMISPTRNVDSPTRNIESPTRNVESPSRNVDSPTRNKNSTTRNINSPRRSIESPRRYSYTENPRSTTNLTGRQMQGHQIDTMKKSYQKGTPQENQHSETGGQNEPTYHAGKKATSKNPTFVVGNSGQDRQKQKEPNENRPKQKEVKLHRFESVNGMNLSGQSGSTVIRRQTSVPSKPKALENFGIFMTKGQH